MRLALLTTKSTIPTSKAITLSGAPATGYVKSMGYPSSYRDRTREKAMQNTFLLHLASRHAHVDGGYLANAALGVAAVVDTLRASGSFKVGV